jgi:hypothetical protein
METFEYLGETIKYLMETTEYKEDEICWLEENFQLWSDTTSH